MDARLDLGFFGFSWNSVILSSSSATISPKRDASSHGTSITATLNSAFFSLWNFKKSL